MSQNYLFYPLQLILQSLVSVAGIIGGHSVLDYPFFVKVELRGIFSGGTLVSDNTVLTAANCLFHKDKNRWADPHEVMVSKNIDQMTQQYKCECFRPHELYRPGLNNGRGPFDIAVIKLRNYIEFSDPGDDFLEICPDDIQHREGLTGLAIGMGLIKKIQKYPRK